MNFPLLDTLGCFEVKKWWYKKTILYLLEDNEPFQNFEKIFFFVRSHFDLQMALVSSTYQYIVVTL